MAPTQCIVLIAAPELLPSLKQRTDSSHEVLTFSDAEALRALEVITKRRPGVVALERLFAATPRGAALINRIKADPALGQSEIRVVSHDGEYARVSPRAAAPPSPVAAAPVVPAPAVAAPEGAASPPPLDQRGTRRAPRSRIAAGVDALIDGNAVSLVDLSEVGAQVVSATILKPNQRVRMALPDEAGMVRFSAAVAWAAFEIPPQSGPRYRAGVQFIDADASAVRAFCQRHKG